jgi:tRNA(Ser,Leu) C12 N-acetylase TAN1
MTTGNIFVFKTSLQSQTEVQLLSLVFDNLGGITCWNVDLDDWEKILRIESAGISPIEIISILKNYSITCKQL